VLTAPVLVSHQRLQQIQEEWRGLPDLMGDSGRDTRQALDALRTLAQNSQDATLRTQLEGVQNELEAAYSAGNETRDRTVKALIRMGAFLANKIEDADRRLRSIDKTIGIARTDFATLTEKIAILKQQAATQPNAAELIARADQALTQAQGKLDSMTRNYDQVSESRDTALSYYGDMVIEVADDYPMDVLEPQLAILAIEFDAKESQYLQRYANFFITHIREYQTSGSADKAHWLEEILQ
jgi:chromosome segregation ATPase